MNSIVIFTDECAHWAAPYLKPGFRHVWCILHDERCYWISHNWLAGRVSIRAEAMMDWQALAQHYARPGWRVLALNSGPMMQPPIILNNCVGHTKTLLGVRAPVWTPYGLYKHLTEKWDAIEVLPADQSARDGRRHTGPAPAATAA